MIDREFIKSVDNMIKKFQSGWIPTNDEEWINFKLKETQQ